MESRYQKVNVSLVIGYFRCALVANSDLKLVAERGYGRAVLAALVADGRTAAATMMLPLAHRLLLPHHFDIPKEGLLAVLAHVALLPLRVLLAPRVHVPHDNVRVLGAAEQLSRQRHVKQSVNAVLVAF